MPASQFFDPTIREKNGRWYIRFYDPGRRPKMVERSLGTKKKSVAEKLKHKRAEEYLRDLYDPWTYGKATEVTLDEAIDSYVEDDHLRGSTIRSKRYRLDPFSRKHPHMLVSGVDESMLREYCLRRDLRRDTQLRYLYEFRKFLSFCTTKGWLANNPAQDILNSLPAHVKREKRTVVEYLSQEDVRRLIRAIEADIDLNPRREARRVLIDVILMAVTTGLRRSELCNLRWRDIRLQEISSCDHGGYKPTGWIIVRGDDHRETKTGDEDRVPLIPVSADILVRRRVSQPDTEFVFGSPRSNGPLDGEWISKIFREYRHLARLPESIHFHSLRHTCASWLAEKGISMRVIQEILRHTNLKQTLRYAHLQPDHIAEQAKVGLSDFYVE